MREIKFRGKRKDTGEWVYGWYVKGFGGEDYIIVTFGTIVVSYKVETVGQYTGLKDKNGKEIYEGDILDVDGTPWLVEPIGTEERDGGKFGLCASPYGSGEAYFIDKSILDGKVIGNIYEHPHLLKGCGVITSLPEAVKGDGNE